MKRILERNSDRELVDRVLSGDRSADRILVHRHERTVKAATRRRGLPDHIAEEIYAQVFARLWEDDLRRLRQWRGHDLRGYLARTAQRLAYDALRRLITERENLPRLRADRQTEDPAITTIRRWEAGVVRRSIGNLSGRDADMLRLRYFDDESCVDIATRLDLTPVCVGVVLHRARKQLRLVLERTHPETFIHDSDH